MLNDLRPADGEFDVQVVHLQESSPAPRSVRACAAVRQLDLDGPVHFVLCADALELAPALATSQRAARRPAVGYTLIDPTGPIPSDPAWPDAPITVLCTGEPDRSWALRGWRVERVDHPRDIVPALIASVRLTSPETG